MSTIAKVSEFDKSNIKDPVYRIDFETTLDQYTTKAGASLPRRYSDFTHLHAVMNDLHPERFIPALPTLRNVAGYGQVPQGVCDDVCREAMELWLRKVCASEHLRKSTALQAFLESGQNYNSSANTSSAAAANSATKSVSSFFKNVAKSVKSTTKEIDPWFEHSKYDLNTRMGYLEKCGRAVEKVGKSRRSLGMAYAELAARLSDLSGVELSPQLSSGYRKFSASFSKCSTFIQTIGDTQLLYTTDYIHAQIKATEAADKAFDNRLVALGDYENACKKSMKNKQSVDKVRSSGTSSPTGAAPSGGALAQSKIDAAMSELKESKAQEEAAKQFLTRISATIREEEWDKFATERNEDAVKALKGYAVLATLVGGKEANEWRSCAKDIAGGGEYANGAGNGEKIAAEVL